MTGLWSEYAATTAVRGPFMLKNQRQEERTALLRGHDSGLRKSLRSGLRSMFLAFLVEDYVQDPHGSWIRNFPQPFFNYSPQLMSQAALSYRRLRIIDRESFGELQWQGEVKTELIQMI
jgi:hypothetical protein